MKKRILSMLLVITMIVTMMPTVTLAAQTETFGAFTVTTTSGDASTVATYEESAKVLRITGDCTIANTDPGTPTNDTISIESDCTVSLDGVNIEALAPENRNDSINSNPININGAYEVTIFLVDGKKSTLGFTESSNADSDNINIKLGSGKAGLHVPSDAALTIDGTGALSTTGAEGFNAWTGWAHGGGGAGIGGDGRRTYEKSDAEASGTIIIKNGTINAQGGNTTGFWGGGGAGIGGGGGTFEYGGGSSGKVIITGGTITATGGSPGNTNQNTGGSGIGAGGRGGVNNYFKGTDGTADEVIISGGIVKAIGGVKLNDATSPEKGGLYGVQGKTITISGESTRLDAQGALRALSSEPTTSDIGRIVSTTDGSWSDANKLVQFFTAIDPDNATVETAKTALENASYNDMNQEDATNEEAIIEAVKSTAETAVNNSEVTVVVNKGNYLAPVAGTSANPNGTNGSYTFTITVSKGLQSQTTSEKTIVIKATAYTGVTDEQAVDAAKEGLIDGSVDVDFGATQADKTAAVQSYVENLLSGISDATGVSVSVTYNSTTGTYDVTLSKGSVNDKKSLTMNVIVAPDPDIATVEAAKTAAENASYSNMTQEDATNEETIIAALKSAAETVVDNAVNNSDVTVLVNQVSYSAPVAGTSANPAGTNGSYAFTITVSKGSQSQITTVKTIVIKATTYTGVTDVQAVDAAKAAIVDSSVNVDFGVTQEEKTSEVQSYVDNLLSTIPNATGVTAVVSYNSATGTYDVTLSKGSVIKSKSLTMTVNVVPDPDIATVEAAKTAAENATYNDMNQEDATNEEAIIAALKSAAETVVDNAVNSSGVTVSVNQVSYSAPVEGTSANPDGTNGRYTFTITVSKGLQSQITTEKTIVIKATTYTGVADVQAVEAAKAAIITAIANLTVSNKTIDRDILTAAQNASLHGVTVAWDTTKGFNKTNATSTVAGTIQGTIILSLDSVTCTVEVNKTIAKLSFEDNGSSSGNNNVSTPVKTEGKIEKDQKQDENAPVTSLNDSSEDLKSKVLSAADLAQVATGKDAKVILKVKDISTSVSEEDKIKIEEKLAEEQQNTAKAELLYIDISLFKQIGEGQEIRVANTSGKISISIEIPKDMRSTIQGVDRTYSVIRIHNGVADSLSGTYDHTTNLFTFETDQFSTYALTYKDVNTTTDILTVYNDFYHLRLKAEGAKTSQKLTYVNVAGADGYLIYGAKCGQSLKKIADVKGTVLSYTVKNLKQATYYKYQVKAYKIIDGEKVIISTSKVVHSITEDKTYANPSKVTADVTSIKLSVGNTKTIACQVVLPKDKKMKKHTAITRYESTNKEIATVNSNGKITAKGKGTCYLYVYAQNGVYVKIKLTVK